MVTLAFNIQTAKAEQTVIIQPNAVDGKDSTVHNHKPDGNWGTHWSLLVGTFYNGIPVTFRSFIQFNLNIIPANALITSAQLNMATAWPTLPLAYDIDLHQVVADWDEMTVTWNNQPSFNPLVVATVPATGEPRGEWQSWNVTSLVQAWVNGSATNYGVVLKVTNEAVLHTRTSFVSSDSSAPSQWKPKLVVTYVHACIKRIDNLIETIETWSLPKGTENNFKSKLEEAQHLFDMGNENGAIHKLMDLMKQAEALQGKKLTNDQTNYLISELQRIIDLIKG